MPGLVLARAWALVRVCVLARERVRERVLALASVPAQVRGDAPARRRCALVLHRCPFPKPARSGGSAEALRNEHRPLARIAGEWSGKCLREVAAAGQHECARGCIEGIFARARALVDLGRQGGVRVEPRAALARRRLGDRARQEARPNLDSHVRRGSIKRPDGPATSTQTREMGDATDRAGTDCARASDLKHALGDDASNVPAFFALSQLHFLTTTLAGATPEGSGRGR